MAELSKEQIEALVKKNEALEKENAALKKAKQPESNFKVSKDASVSYEIEVESLEGDAYHENGEKFNAGEKNAIRLAEAKKVKILGKFKDPDNEAKAKKLGLLSLVIIALMSFGFSSFAQTGDFFNPLSTGGVAPKSDTVVNTATAFITCKKLADVNASYVTVQVNVTKISGTVGGTISLQGSLDGVNFKALNTRETQTALATITATDATNVYHWRLDGSPFLYYRVSWTGTGTMSASFSAQLYRVKY